MMRKFYKLTLLFSLLFSLAATTELTAQTVLYEYDFNDGIGTWDFVVNPAAVVQLPDVSATGNVIMSSNEPNIWGINIEHLDFGNENYVGLSFDTDITITDTISKVQILIIDGTDTLEVFNTNDSFSGKIVTDLSPFVFFTDDIQLIFLKNGVHANIDWVIDNVVMYRADDEEEVYFDEGGPKGGDNFRLVNCKNFDGEFILNIHNNKNTTLDIEKISINFIRDQQSVLDYTNIVTYHQCTDITNNTTCNTPDVTTYQPLIPSGEDLQVIFDYSIFSSEQVYGLAEMDIKVKYKIGNEITYKSKRFMVNLGCCMDDTNNVIYDVNSVIPLFTGVSDNIILRNENTTINSNTIDTIETIYHIKDPKGVVFRAGRAITIQDGFTFSSAIQVEMKITSCNDELNKKYIDTNSPIQSLFTKQLNIYPNPFAYQTNISFDIYQTAFYSLKVYNYLGNEIQTILDHQILTKGLQKYSFNLDNLPQGVYYITLSSKKGKISNKIIKL